MKAGDTIAHYQVLDLLGEGGMGVVYKARDVDLDRLVALKFVSPFLAADVQARERLIREAKATSSLDDPNICTIYEIGETRTDRGKQLYIAMAFYEGETLEDRISRGPIPSREAARLFAQTASGLARAHEAGVVHRDIKSANIFITDRGLVKILDFGIAKLTEGTQLTKAGATTGTVAYMSPEQTRGDAVDHRTDLWSLGVVLHEMLAGERPFRGTYDQAIIYSVLNEDPEPISADLNVPGELIGVLAKLLQKDPADRYQSADEVLIDLGARTGTRPR